MAYTRRDTEDAFLGGTPFPPSEATLQPDQEHVNPPPHFVAAAAPSMHCSSYGPQWNARTLHSSVQDQRYGISGPYVNGMPCGCGVCTDAQQGAPFTPAVGTMSDTVTPYMNQNQYSGTDDVANGPTAYYHDNRITATDTRDLHDHFTTEAQHGGVVCYGPTLAGAGGTSAHSAAGNAPQTFAPDGEAQ